MNRNWAIISWSIAPQILAVILAKHAQCLAQEQSRPGKAVPGIAESGNARPDNVGPGKGRPDKTNWHRSD